MKYNGLIKSIIIVLMIVTIIISIILVYLSKKKTKTELEGEIAPEGDLILDTDGGIVQNFNEYDTVKSCINSLILYAKAGNNTAIEEITEGEYIFQNVKFSNNNRIMLAPVYRIDNDAGNVNFVSFKVDNESSNIYGIVILDGANQTFKILKASEADYNNAKNHNIDNKYKKYTSIDIKTYNKFRYSLLNEGDVIKQYFNDYIQKANYYPEEAYNILDEKYKTNKFNTFLDFQNYLNQRKEQLEALDIYNIKTSNDFKTDEEYESYLMNFKSKGLKQYLIKDYETYRLYICIDDYDNYYAFKETGAMEYSLYLDDYNILLAEDLYQYNSVDNKGKAALNVKRFLKAVNQEDYIYAYNMLSEGFKKNYFETLQKFIKYIENQNIDYNNIKNIEVREESNIYICILKTNDNKTMQFNVQLLDNQEYKISFKVEETK